MDDFGMDFTAGEEDDDQSRQGDDELRGNNIDQSDSDDDDIGSKTESIKRYIIQEVKQRRYLYDQSDQLYSTTTVTNNAWNDIQKSVKKKYPDFNGKLNSL